MRSLALVCSIVVLLALPAAARADAAETGRWLRPVEGRVVRPFDPPETRFGAGHLGVDLAAPPGTSVRAAGAGVVAFAGRVAGALHVVVAHAGGVRTSYSFLATVAVRRGDVVAAGQVVGTTGGTGEGHDGSVLHLGLRVGDRYVDPMQLFGPVDLTALVHLAPTTEAPAPESEPDERRGLLAGLGHRLAGIGNATRRIAGLAAGALGAAGGLARDAIEGAARSTGRTLASAFPVPLAFGKGLEEWLGEQGHCDPHAPRADGKGGSGHRVMVVAGIESSLTGGKSSLPLPVGELGYRPDEVDYYSYAKHGGDYAPADTEGPLLAAARRLGAQLRDVERRDPGREVDLLAHSQGGVVVEAFLTMVYEPTDPSYPPLGTVVTLSSPLRGDPLATAIAEIAGTPAGRAALSAADRLDGATGDHVPPTRAAAVRDLASDSELMRQLDASRIPAQVDLTTIGAATDFVVPGTASSRPGSRSTVIVPTALNAHTGILTDASALRAVRAALEDKPLPCRSLTTILAGEVVPTVITEVEGNAGDALASATSGAAGDWAR